MNINNSNIKEKTKYVFVGNRKFVLEEMKNLKLNICEIISIKGSHLERQLNQYSIKHIVISNKKELISKLETLDFDNLILNGCPFILPITGYKNKSAKLINIHPSYLPSLRGCDPVPGALLLQQDSGATCHIIDEGIDTGPIISRVRIPNTEDLDAQLLYKLSFLAEKEVFNLAYKLNFAPQNIITNPKIKNSYYSASEEDQIINFRKDSNNLILRKNKAFSNFSRGVNFTIKGFKFKSYFATLVVNPYFKKHSLDYKNGDIVMILENGIIIKLNEEFIRFDPLQGEKSKLKVGLNIL